MQTNNFTFTDLVKYHLEGYISLAIVASEGNVEWNVIGFCCPRLSIDIVMLGA